MPDCDSAVPSAFDKARTGLWTSLQKHLVAVYAAEAAYLRAVAFAEITARYARVQQFACLNVKGLPAGLLSGAAPSLTA